MIKQWKEVSESDINKPLTDEEKIKHLFALSEEFGANLLNLNKKFSKMQENSILTNEKIQFLVDQYKSLSKRMNILEYRCGFEKGDKEKEEKNKIRKDIYKEWVQGKKGKILPDGHTGYETF